MVRDIAAVETRHVSAEPRRERGSVEHGQYQVIEAPYRPGERVAFEGTLWLLGESRKRAEEARDLDARRR